MSTADRDRLRQIKTFPSLVKYLRDELEWPIESEDFDDLTFDYEPEELGLDAKAAVKIKQIKQLRPLADKQPWGIFFINFEPKRLPVVALRRILRSLVIKKRQSANRPQQAAWKLHDLLFISSYGEADHRDITFAHFSEDADHDGGLPTLRVLGWDDEDTVLHLEHAHKTLKEKLLWPDDPDDLAAWRESWSQAFTLRHREVINTSKALAVRMAELASAIRKRANRVLGVESEKGPLRKLMSAFKEALIHDLSDDDFADMYAQTITYGLLTARVSQPTGLVADNVADMVPITNPFLKELMETFLNVGGRRNGGRRESGIDFDELGINDVVDTLRAANMEAVVRDFGDRNPQEDPVIHFYELFLKEYDAKKRMQRGVFYTPRPVVSFIVRSVDEILRTEFGLEDGLADTTTWGEMAERLDDLEIPEGVSPDQAFVQILDPATGTGTFLVEVIDVIHRTMTAKWEKEGHLPLIDIPKLWNEYVPRHLLPRLYGYELMMAPYAIAHMKIGLKLFGTGYKFGSGERARIYLTNALEPPQDFSDTFEQMAPALAHEAQAVNDVKRHQRFTVVIGNPPYSVLSANLSETSRRIIDRYRFVAGEKIEERSMLRLEMHLQDDYVKFLALSQTVLGDATSGVFGFITNSGYLDNLTLRGVRFSLHDHFPRATIVNLHGSRQRRASCDDEADENVFDIEQGVAIFVGASRSSSDQTIRQEYSDVTGSRERKYKLLLSKSISSLQCVDLFPKSPHYFLVPHDDAGRDEYDEWVSIVEAMPVNISGIVTAHDNLVVDFDDHRLIENAATLRNRSLSDDDVRKRLAVKDNAGWKLSAARAELRRSNADEPYLKPYAYRPFDTRRIYYHSGLVWCDRRKVMSHTIARKNIAIATCRQLARLPLEHVFVTRSLQDDCFISNRTRERSYHFPLHLYGDSRQRGMQAELSFKQDGPQANLSAGFLAGLQRTLGKSRVSASVAFYYVYSVLHSPCYRTKYAELLKIDFPRIPILANAELFRTLGHRGRELVALHLMESPRLEKPITTYTGPPKPQVEKVSYAGGTVWLDKKQTRGFAGVPEAVWNFHIGGYQVCEKWLKDRQAKGGKNPRPGRVLTDEDIDHYQKIVVALSETIRIMAEIDEVIESHGGWPDAFVTKSD